MTKILENIYVYSYRLTQLINLIPDVHKSFILIFNVLKFTTQTHDSLHTISKKKEKILNTIKILIRIFQ
jgi:hypothetical protein